MTDEPHGLDRGRTNFGDADFSFYLRRSFGKSMGYSRAMLARPVIGVAHSKSGFNNGRIGGVEVPGRGPPSPGEAIFRE
jgi:dihydroxy-acid dehydratase